MQKVFLEEVSEPQTAFWSPGFIKSFLQMFKGLYKKFLFLALGYICVSYMRDTTLIVSCS